MTTLLVPKAKRHTAVPGILRNLPRVSNPPAQASRTFFARGLYKRRRGTGPEALEIQSLRLRDCCCVKQHKKNIDNRIRIFN